MERLPALDILEDGAVLYMPLGVAFVGPVWLGLPVINLGKLVVDEDRED